MSSRSETSVSTLERLRADAESIERMLAIGRAALPGLAMGADAEGVVHVGLDRGGEVVRLDLDASWRDALPLDGLGGAVSDALQHAVQIRTGDWAAALAAHHVPAERTGRSRAGTPVARTAATGSGPVVLGSDAHGPVVTVAPGWTTEADDDTIRAALLSALTTRPTPTATASARPAEVRDLAQRTRDALLDRADGLPRFMRSPVQESLERVHDDVAEALTLPVAQEGVASRELGAYAARLQETMCLLDRPAGLPAASEVWVGSAVGLTTGLASARRPPLLSRWRRRSA